MQREEMGIVNGNPMGMGTSMVGEWEWEWLYGNGREWESERHSRTPLPWTTFKSCAVICVISLT